jgi:hypothetical protein
MDLVDVVNNLNQITSDVVERKILEILSNYKNEMLDMERQRLLEGKDANDKDIQPPYNDSYGRYKLKFNPLGVVDLTLTGAFTGAFTVDLTAFPIVFYSIDKKTFQLTAKYGEDIFGEREEDLDTIRDYLLKGLQDWLFSLLGIQ